MISPSERSQPLKKNKIFALAIARIAVLGTIVTALCGIWFASHRAELLVSSAFLFVTMIVAFAVTKMEDEK